MNENEILKALIWDETDGSLRYKGVRYLLIRPETLGKLMEVEGPGVEGRAGESLFQGGFTGGFLSSKTYRDMHGFSDEEIIAFMMSMGGQIGWGRFSLEAFDAESSVLAVRVKGSPFAEVQGEAKGPACHLIRGIVAGMGSALLGRQCGAVETSCEAMGDDCCRFILDAGQGS